MHYAVAEFGELSAIPAAGGSYEITGDTLKLVDVVAAAVRTFGQTLLCVFEAAVHAAVTVVIDRTVSDVVSVHEVYDAHYRFRIVSRVSVDLYIEDVSSSSKFMIWSLDFSLMLWSTFIIYWYVV